MGKGNSTTDNFFAVQKEKSRVKTLIVTEFFKAYFPIINATFRRDIWYIDLFCGPGCYDNIWMGVSIENQDTISRADFLKQTGAHIKFISAEPLLSPLPNLDLQGIDWLIVGGESGPGSRPMLEEWVMELKSKCDESDTAFFFKQWGGTNKKKSGSLLGGIEYKNYPTR